MIMLMMFMITMSMIMIMMNHPLSMGLILLIQTMLTALLSGMMSQNFWYSYILFLIMIGGMLILFIYMTSIASNEKFLFTNKLLITMFMTLTLNFYMNLIKDNLFAYQMMKMEDMFISNFNINFYLSLNKFLNYPSNLILIIIISYLLVTLIAIVKITNIKYGPLRQK